jgi:hypothetical protein
MQLKTIISILLLTSGAGAALAHDYDPNKPVRLSGTVKDFKWGKPYVKIHLSVKDNTGKTKDWELETADPSALESDGLGPTAIKKGDNITVEGDRASDGSEHALVRSMTLADGRNISIRAVQAAAPSAGAEAKALPTTATNTPLIALIGLVALSAGTVLSLLSARVGR